MVRILLGLLFVGTLLLPGGAQDPKWDAKTTFNVARVLGRLAPLNPDVSQLDRLASKAALVQRAREEYEKSLQSHYERERSRAEDFVKYAVSGIRYTQQQLARLEEWQARLEVLEEQYRRSVEEIVRGSVDILTKSQYDSIAIRPQDRQEALEFMSRIRSVPDSEWERFAQGAVMEFMRSEMRAMRGELENIFGGDREARRGGPREELRAVFEQARERAMQRLRYYRNLPENQVQQSVDQLARERIGEEGMRDRVVAVLRDILTPEGAREAILTLRNSKAAQN